MTDYSPVDTIVAAPTDDGVIVTAVHLPGQQLFCVACSCCGPLATDTYSATTDSVEVRLCRRNANLRASLHASGCAETIVYTDRTLTAATSGGRP